MRVNPNKNTIVVKSNTRGFLSQGQEGRGGVLIIAFCAVWRGIKIGRRISFWKMIQRINGQFEELTKGAQLPLLEDAGATAGKFFFYNPESMKQRMQCGFEDK